MAEYYTVNAGVFYGGKFRVLHVCSCSGGKVSRCWHLQLEYKRLEYSHFIVTSANTMDAEHVVESCVRGYHYYQNIWDPRLLMKLLRVWERTVIHMIDMPSL